MDAVAQQIGVIGTGEIAEVMIAGLRHAGIATPIVVSPRSIDRSARLADELPDLVVGESNQDVVDRSSLVIVAVLPSQLDDVLVQLDFAGCDLVLSVVAGRSAASLASMIDVDVPVARAIPMPPNRDGRGPIPLFPDLPLARNLLEPLGRVVAVEDESHFDVLTGGSATMGAFFGLTATIAGWMRDHGVPAGAAAAYVTELFESLAFEAKALDPDELAVRPETCLTPGGLNEQVLRGLDDAEVFDHVREQLDRILVRVRA